MKIFFERTSALIGEEGIKKLENAKILIFGVGGVGSYVCEGLARAGVGSITMVDSDAVDETNINRQIPALMSTIGCMKVHVMADRIRDINPDCEVRCKELFYMPESRGNIDFAQFDYVVDAIDTIAAKIQIISDAKAADVPVISSMGTGNKLDPTAFRIADINETRVCPLAKVMRRELRKRGLHSIKVLYSEEEPKGRGGSISFVPSVAGLIIAGEVVKDILEMHRF